MFRLDSTQKAMSLEQCKLTVLSDSTEHSIIIRPGAVDPLQYLWPCLLGGNAAQSQP